MLLLHKDINSANVTNNNGYTALMFAVRCRKEEVLRELVDHQCVSLDVRGLEGDQRYADMVSIVEDAKRRRTQLQTGARLRDVQQPTHPAPAPPGQQQGQQPHGSSGQGATSSAAAQSSEAAASTLGAAAVSRAPTTTTRSSLSSHGPPSRADDPGPQPNEDVSLSECMRRCRLELEELQKHQSEKVQLLLKQNEEKEEKLREENRDKEQKLKAENERSLATLMEQNEVQEAMMIAKHEEEKRAVRKAEELEAERNAPSAPSHPSIPECPVCLEEMAPPTRIFQCRNGHLLCETCKIGLNPCICPKCRQEMTGRATDMENFLRSLQ